jgi:diphthine synthase
MLYLIGTGLHDYRDMSLRALDILKKVDRIFFENYTSPQRIGLKPLEKILGKKIKLLSRRDIEDSEAIFSKKDTALLVIGDPLVATTHQNIIETAMNKGIKVKVIHSSSIVSAVCETGLHIYKFGKTTSIPFLSEGFSPKSPCETIRENLSIKAHTLVLLDIGMKAREAIDYLLSKCDLKRGTKAFLCADLGGKSLIISGTLGELEKREIDQQPQVLIIPAEMHFTEEKTFARFSDSNG